MGSGSEAIGVPRFELGTSPTRTERATRLRHTPGTGHRVASGAPRSPLRRRLHAGAARARARAGGIRPSGERHGLTLDASRYEAARDAALVDLHRHPELEHDDEIWFRFTERIVLGMGGDADRPTTARSRSRAAGSSTRTSSSTTTRLTRSRALRAAGPPIGLVSNSARDVREFARHHALDVDAGISSFHHGRTKPHASIFRAVLDLLEVEPPEAVMVGDTIADDVEGALALGMRAILLDRERVHPDFEPRVESLNELAPLLGL